MRYIKSTAFFILLLFVACQPKDIADMVIINGEVATVNQDQPTAQALAIKGDRIMNVGSDEEISKLIGDATEVIDANGEFVMPGFIEGHGHFSGLGNSLMILNFMNSKNWDEIVAQVKEKVDETEEGEWITGRGWHQEKWDKSPDRQVLGYPYHDHLSDISPDNPIVLRHASGHSLFANKKAMDIAGVTKETPNPSGGNIVRNASGEAIGVFEERAMGIITKAYQEFRAGISEEQKLKEWHDGIELAEEECISKGITSFQDAGSSYAEIERYKKLAENSELDLRLWVMIRQSFEAMKDNPETKPLRNYGNHFFTVGGIKAAVDGALGAFGAWLLDDYEDQPGFYGQNTTTIETLEGIAEVAIENDLQYCIHAIGDRANQEVLNIFEKTFKSHPGKTNLRWRIEHSQHLAIEDIPRFGELGVIASMQAIHCTSDAPFVEKRLGKERAKYGAYPWRSLLDAGAVVTNGTDAPVEDVDPIPSFYASVTRSRSDTDLIFYPEQAMTREEALYSYTMACAFAAFEEDDKGSLEPGKLADIVILSENLLSCNTPKILDAEVLYTIIGGNVKYQKEI
ncbi:MAG: amidohydrolase [Bacteroidia bacterium]|nr:amidohydrolase [Bacteroidia bacterium]